MTYEVVRLPLARGAFSKWLVIEVFFGNPQEYRVASFHDTEAEAEVAANKWYATQPR